MFFSLLTKLSLTFTTDDLIEGRICTGDYGWFRGKWDNQKTKNCLLLIFSPNLASNGQIWLFHVQKWIFSENLVLCWTYSSPGNFTEKYVLKIVEQFSLHCLARKSSNLPQNRLLHGLLIRMQNISLRTLYMRRKQDFALSPLLFFSFSCLMFLLLLGNVFRKAFRILVLDERYVGSGTRFLWEFFQSQRYIYFCLFLRPPWLNRVHSGMVSKISSPYIS